MPKPSRKTIVYILSTIIFFLLVFVAGAFIFDQAYNNHIYPGVSAAGISLGGEGFDSAKNKLRSATQHLEDGNIVLLLDGKEFQIPAQGSDQASDSAYQVITIDYDQVISQAFAYGRASFWLQAWKERWQALVFGFKVPASFNIDKESLVSLLHDKVSESFSAALPARLIAATSTPSGLDDAQALAVTGSALKLYIQPEKAGWEVDYSSAASQLEAGLSIWKSVPISVEAKKIDPEINSNSIGNWQAEAKSLLALAPFKLSYTATSTATSSDPWEKSLDAGVLAGWLDFQKSGSSIILSWDKDKIGAYLQDNIAPAFNQIANKAQFSIKDNKVADFKLNGDGRELLVKESLAAISQALDKKTNQAELAANIIIGEKPKDLADLGIIEVIGTGHSNFAGSPVNRRHNIKVGADSLNGVIIKPGEEFSLIKALGKIDGSSGYLTELVIKQNKTIPEFGGGLCQIGTTVFRATLASGLPITMRRNHSYRVVYYEPAGTDATIYDPWPDYRFINDTGKHIMIQSRFEGKNDIYFDFWGTKDGRIATSTAPTIYNIVKPEPTRTVETLDLPVGQKKCTEKAHNGADAYFDYKVTYPATSSDPIVKEKRFSSHYVPWQAVCLVGVKTLTASSTSVSTPLSPDIPIIQSSATSTQ